ncbi:glycosyltransferase family 87 protein [Mesorhizobium sp. VK9D]|uniref:glycosyltransferase family 87 protein n=1 Tax=Mesorhizobium australafricanum TaxID=3072311 RepID=UPI002A23FFB0|nr:glycosyltransferase family 87 protein [Mesorhizobium sp. VK9D]MDX8455899.1 glycosyltransferase family 87 protein [Mesorhizobium sp. VK9D]
MTEAAPQTGRIRPRSLSDVAVVTVAAIIALYMAELYLRKLWTLGPDGLSGLSKTLPYWDFSNLWGGGRMALDAHVGLLFDVDAYRAALRGMFTPNLPNQEWSYPPSILLIGAPLAALPILPAYLIWTFGTIVCLWLAIRPLKLGGAAELAIVLSPAVIWDAVFGQNGALTTALLIGGLALAPRRPVLAGVLFGLLTIKPHLGILVPFCLLASGNWRAIVAAVATTIAIVLATGLCFGFDVWTQFLTQTRPLMTAIMEAPFPQHYHANAITVFFTARALGFGVTAAYGLQAIATIAAIAAVIWLWWPDRRVVEHRERVVLTAVLAVLATPYGYTYDTIGATVAVALLFTSVSRPPGLILAACWLYAFFAHILNNAGFHVGVLVPSFLAGWMFFSIWVRSREADMLPAPAARI